MLCSEDEDLPTFELLLLWSISSSRFPSSRFCIMLSSICVPCLSSASGSVVFLAWALYFLCRDSRKSFGVDCFSFSGDTLRFSKNFMLFFLSHLVRLSRWVALRKISWMTSSNSWSTSRRLFFVRRSRSESWMARVANCLSAELSASSLYAMKSISPK